jgi:hypothetical protein
MREDLKTLRVSLAGGKRVPGCAVPIRAQAPAEGPYSTAGW